MIPAHTAIVQSRLGFFKVLWSFLFSDALIGKVSSKHIFEEGEISVLSLFFPLVMPFPETKMHRALAVSKPEHATVHPLTIPGLFIC